MSILHQASDDPAANPSLPMMVVPPLAWGLEELLECEIRMKWSPRKNRPSIPWSTSIFLCPTRERFAFDILRSNRSGLVVAC